MKPVEYQHVSISYYANEPILIGDFVFSTKNPRMCTKRKNGNLIGVSLHNFSKQLDNFFSIDTVLEGSKISILTDGILMYQLNPCWKLPFGQPLYLTNNGKITWRRQGVCVACTCSTQDQSGYVQVRIKGLKYE